MTDQQRPASAEFEAAGDALRAHGLAIVGTATADALDGTLPEEVRCLLLIGPDGAEMWPVFSRSPEASDGEANPLDRWSRRIIDAVALELSAEAHYPFGGPPYAPFLQWARLAEHARPSPIRLLVSPLRGLWMSYRGALAFRRDITVPPGVEKNPCLDCPAPCVSACPVEAFAGEAYDVRACLGHLISSEGTQCTSGCLARHACPVGTPPPVEQRRFHMHAFVESGRHRV